MNISRYLLSYRTRSNQFCAFPLDEWGLSLPLSQNLGVLDVRQLQSDIAIVGISSCSMHPSIRVAGLCDVVRV